MKNRFTAVIGLAAMLLLLASVACTDHTHPLPAPSHLWAFKRRHCRLSPSNWSLESMRSQRRLNLRFQRLPLPSLPLNRLLSLHPASLPSRAWWRRPPR